MYLVNSEGEIINQWFKLKKHYAEGFIYKNLLKENFILPTSVVIRKEVYNQVGGFDPSIINADDYDLWLRIAKSYPIGLINEPLVKWRIHDFNHSKNLPLMKNNVLKVYEKQIAEEDNDWEARRILREKLSEEYFHLGKLNFGKELIKGTKDKFLRSLNYGFHMKVLINYLLTFLPFHFVLVLFKIKSRLMKRGTAGKIMSVSR